MKLCKLILRYQTKSNTHKEKIVEFNTDVTLITGSSKKGKSAIIELVDYVLFSSENTIPAGVIKDSVNTVILEIIFKGEKICLIRETKYNKMQMIKKGYDSITQIKQDEYKDKTFIQDAIERKLNLYTTKFIKTHSIEDNQKHKYSIRYQLPYNFLAQNVIANKDVIFRNFADYRYKKFMKDYFEVYVGLETPKNKYYKLKKIEIKKKIQNLEAEIEYRQEIFKKQKKEILDKINMLRSSKGLSTLSNFKDVIEEDNILNQKALTSSFDDSEIRTQIDTLKIEKQKKAKLVETITMEIDELKAFDKTYTHKTKDIIELSVNECPLCNQESSGINKFIQEYNESVNKYNLLDKDLTTFQKNELEQLIIEYESKLNKSKKELNDAERNLLQLQKSYFSVDDNMFWREYYKIVSQIPQFNSSEDRQKLNQLKNEYGEIKGRIKPSSSKTFYEKLNKNLTEIVRKFDIEEEFVNIPLKFDVKDFYLYFGENKKGGIGLTNTGSGANWEAMHLALNIAIIKTAKEENPDTTTLFPFLFIDQPTQVYFSSYDDMIRRNDYENVSPENEAIIKLFTSLLDVCEASGIQLIILEHIKPEHFQSINRNLFQKLCIAKTEDWHQENALLEI